LFCLHSADAASRTFSGILPELADVRSVYAPDLPGFGESDPSPTRSIAEAAGAISDLANDLRLRQIDLMGIQFGADVALELAATRPELVRRLVLAGAPATGRIAAVKQPHWVVDVAAYGTDPFGAGSQNLAKQIAGFLRGRG
jgi:pimeloyl-ACP methyl ester carboxylesterase